MRKRFLLLCWCLWAIVSCSEAAQPDRGTLGVKPKAVTGKAINLGNLYSGSYALVIGASAYRSSGWPSLRGVLDDVAAVQTALEQQGFQVTTVLDPDRVALLKAFDDFINAHGRNEGNRLLFYFAGHGYTDTTSWGETMGYIVPVDAPNPLEDLNGFLNFGIDMQQIEVYAKRVRSKHALFIFDSCFSGSIFALSRGVVPPDITYKTSLPVRQFLTSGSAKEQVPDQSLFRQQFVAGLAGKADTNADGYVTGMELGMFLQNKVINYSRDAQHPQFGTIRTPGLDEGDFVFQVNIVVTPPQDAYSGSQPILPPDDSGFSLTKLKEQESWEKWQGNMQKRFNETAAFQGSAAMRKKAWQLFLDAYNTTDNPYSQDDERLRAAAQQRLAGIVNEPERKEFEPEMVDIPAGSFKMGSPSGEAGRSNDEGPVHIVQVKAFRMGKHEVTRGQFRAFVDNTGYKTEAEQGGGCYVLTGSAWKKKAAFNWLNLGFAQEDNHPVACVSWNDAVAYTEWLARETGKPYRLPSEAEWEYAARAGTTTRYYWGNEIDPTKLNFSDKHDPSGPARQDLDDNYAVSAPVGSYAANPWGLHDMLGNVSEWNQDKSHSNYDGAPTDGSAWESGDSEYWLLRGCSWCNGPDDCRSAARNVNTGSYDHGGFRIVLGVGATAF